MRSELYRNPSLTKRTVTYTLYMLTISDPLITFYSECIDKFGPTLGEEVWEMTNKVFDAMPIAAVIDSKVAC